MNIVIRAMKLLSILFVVLSCPNTINKLESQSNIIDYKLSNTTNISLRQDNSFEEKNETVDNTNIINNIEKLENKQEVVNNPTTQEVVVIPTQEKISDSIIIGGILNKELMKDSDGSGYYLNHNINGIYDGIGIPYIDFRTDFTTRKTLIYAHSSKSGNGPFNVIQNYHNNPSYQKSHSYITVNYDGHTYKYQIFSVYISTANDEKDEGLKYFHKMNYSDSAWEKEIQNYKNKSEYDTGVEVNKNDKILILQTCAMDDNYYEKYYRYNLLVMAKLIKVD